MLLTIKLWWSNSKIRIQGNKKKANAAIKYDIESMSYTGCSESTVRIDR